MLDLTFRRREAESMDAPDADPTLLHKSLAYIHRINRLLGYARATVNHFKRFSVHWNKGQTIRILDVATGSADIPRAILNWSRRAGFDVRIIGLDLQPHIAQAARGNATDPALRIIRGNAISLPFADGSMDYVMTNMFLHHLDDDLVVQVFKEMSRVASRGVVAADLMRDRRAYWWICLFTLWANPMVRHDARVSVRQSFTRSEILSLRDQAGLDFTSYHRHFAHRFILSGERPD